MQSDGSWTFGTESQERFGGEGIETRTQNCLLLAGATEMGLIQGEGGNEHRGCVEGALWNRRGGQLKEKPAKVTERE